MKNQIKHISKLMSLALRHQPAVLNLKLDEEGWAYVDDLIEGINRKGIELDKKILDDVILKNDKKRFSYNDDCSKLRANQGHSIKVELNFKEVDPPKNLYHGTVPKFIDIIKTEGIKKMSRHHVHLSKDVETAKNVGSRRGKPIILTINAEEMHNDGFKFYLSENGVWLTGHIPTKYIAF